MRRLTGLWPLVLLCVGLAGCGGARRPAIVVTPASELSDRARSIVIRGLAPHALITVTARSERPDGTWSAGARFRASSAGVVDLTASAPLSGSYRGVSAMGLFWSQRLVDRGSDPPGTAGGRFVSMLTVSVGAKTLASARVTQLPGAPPAPVPATVATHGFAGRYFPAAGAARHPAVIVWGGAEGGLGDGPAKAALLAAHGIPALALAYIGEPGLPCSLENVTLEYFARALEWLREQPQVAPGRVWIEAGSRGTEAALLAAAQWPSLVHGVVAVSPSAVVGGSNTGTCPPVGDVAWTLGGAPVPDGQPIPVQNIRGPVMLLTGGDDQRWPSSASAAQIMSALPHDGAAHVALNYPGAGHAALRIPYGPVPVGLLAYGGTIAANSAAYASDWPASIAFIERN
jgi:dienelactone hydrolase